jgi:hypothetical protein
MNEETSIPIEEEYLPHYEDLHSEDTYIVGSNIEVIHKRSKILIITVRKGAKNDHTTKTTKNDE